MPDFCLLVQEKEQLLGQNYFCVDSKTPRSQIERAFEEFTTREDIAIVLINQHISEEIRYLVENYNGTIPSVLEILSKGKAYDPRKDTIMKRVSAMLGKGFVRLSF